MSLQLLFCVFSRGTISTHVSHVVQCFCQINEFSWIIRSAIGKFIYILFLLIFCKILWSQNIDHFLLTFKHIPKCLKLVLHHNLQVIPVIHANRMSSRISKIYFTEITKTAFHFNAIWQRFPRGNCLKKINAKFHTSIRDNIINC